MRALTLVYNYKYSQEVICIQKVLLEMEQFVKRRLSKILEKIIENLTSFFMEFVIKSRKGEELITSPL